MAKFYVTKYVMTKGIREAPEDAEIRQDKYLRYRGSEFRYKWINPEYFTAEPLEAVARARAARDKKIASLKKQIKRLEALAFNVDEIKKWGEK